MVFLWLERSHPLSTCWNVHFHDSFDISMCCTFFNLKSFSTEQSFEPFHILYSFSLFVYCVVFSQLIYGPSETMDPLPSIPPTFVCLFLFVCLCFSGFVSLHIPWRHCEHGPKTLRDEAERAMRKRVKEFKRTLLNLTPQRPCHSFSVPPS